MSAALSLSTRPWSADRPRSVTLAREGGEPVLDRSVRRKLMRSPASVSVSPANAGMPAPGKPWRRSVVRSWSVRAGIRAAIAGPSSPPFPVVPWHPAQRATKVARPGSGLWAAAIELTHSTHTNARDTRISITPPGRLPAECYSIRGENAAASPHFAGSRPGREARVSSHERSDDGLSAHAGGDLPPRRAG